MNKKLTQELISKNMEAQNLSVAEIAKKMGYSTTAVYNALREAKKMNPQFVSNYARAANLGRVEIGQLLAAMGMEKLMPVGSKRGQRPHKKQEAPKLAPAPAPKQSYNRSVDLQYTNDKRLILKLCRRLLGTDDKTLDIVGKLI